MLISACLAVVDVWLLHGRVGGALAVRLAGLPAVRRVVQFRAARVARGESGCRLFAEAAGVSITPAGPNGVILEIERIRACNSDARFAGLTIRDASNETLVSSAEGRLDLAGGPLAARIEGFALGAKPVLATVGSMDLRATLGDKEIAIGQASATNLRAADDLLVVPYATVAHASVPRIPAPEVVIPLVTAGGAALRLERRADGSWKLPDAGAVRALASGLREVYSSLLAGYARAEAGVHAAAFWLVIIVTVAVAAKKLALTSADPMRRVISAAIPAAAGYLLYWLPVRNPVVYLAAGGAIAAGLVAAIYRHSPEWHQSVEPALVDLVSPMLIGLSLMIHAFALPPLPGEPRRVTIARVQTGPTRLSVLATPLGSAMAEVGGVDADRIVVDLALPGVRADRVQAGPGRVETSPDVLRGSVPLILAEGIRVEKGKPPAGTATLRGVAQSPLLLNQLQRFRFLADAIRHPAPATFCMTWNLGIELPSGCQEADAFDLRGFLDLADFTRISFAADTTLRASGVAVGSSAAGGTTGARLTRIHSLPGSSVEIGAGEGQLTWNRGIAGQIDLQRVQASSFQSASLTLRARATGSRDLAARAAARQVLTSVGQGGASLESAVVDVNRGPAAGNPVTSQTEIRGLRFSSAGTEVDLPELNTAIAGTWRPEGLQGTLTITSSSGSLRALDFSLDPFGGTLAIADQPFEVRQTAVSFLPPRIRGHVKAGASVQPASYYAEARLDPLGLSLLPWRTEITGLRATVASPSRVTFAGTLHAALPLFPARFQFQQAPRLEFSSKGSLKAMAFRANPLPSWKLPPPPEEIRFSGSPGGPVTIATQSGSFEVREFASSLPQLVVNNGRLIETALHAAAGDWSADVALSGSPARVTVSGSVAGARGWLIEAGPRRIHVSAPDVDLQALWPRAAPVLKRFGFVLDGIRPSARLGNIDGAVTFSGGQASSAAGGLQIAPGPLAEVDLNPPFHMATASAAQPISLHAETAPAPEGSFAVTATIRAPSTAAHVESDGGSLTVAGSVDAEVRGLLTRAETPRTLVMKRLIDAFSALRPHAQAAERAFGLEAGDLSWNVEAGGQPALVAGPAKLSANLDVPRLDVTADGTRISGSGRIDLDLAAHGDALIADGRMPVDIEYTRSGAPPERQKLDIPILAAFVPRFPERAPQDGLLWDPAQLAAVWNGYRIRHANTGPVRIFDRPEIAAGNLSLRQIRIPDAPAALTIAAADRLQVNVPLSGSALFGAVDGVAQAEVAWKNGLASVTGRIRGTLTGMQADAVSLRLGGVDSPLVRDQWNAAFDFRSDNVLLNRDRLKAFLWDPGSSDVIDRIGLRLSANRANPDQPDAYVQLSADLDLRRLDRVLDGLLQTLSINAAPQAIRYHDFRFVLQTNGDRVALSPPLVSLTGLRFQPAFLPTDVAAGLRLHLGRPGRDTITVRGVLNYLRSLQ